MNYAHEYCGNVEKDYGPVYGQNGVTYVITEEKLCVLHIDFFTN